MPRRCSYSLRPVGLAATSSPAASCWGGDQVEGWRVSRFEDGEPRVKDTELAEQLEMAAPRNIRQVIKANRGELERYGPVLERTSHVRSRNRHGDMERGVNTYWLNEEQGGLALPIEQAMARMVSVSEAGASE